MPARHFALLLFTCLTVGVALSPLAIGQESLSPPQQAEVDRLHSKVDDFFRAFTDPAVGPEQALRALVEKSSLKTKSEELTRLIDQAVKIEKSFGRYTAHEPLSARAYGSDLVTLRYIYKAERFPVIWYLTFYRPGGNGMSAREWNLIEIRFDTNLAALGK